MKFDPAVDREWFEERAAILEFDAGLPREQAEQIARDALKEKQ